MCNFIFHVCVHVYVCESISVNGLIFLFRQAMNIVIQVCRLILCFVIFAITVN